MYKLLLCFIFIPGMLFAQTDSGSIQFYIYPDYSKIILNNNKLISSKEKIKYPIGKYPLTISGSKLLTFNDSINILKDSTIIFRKILQASLEYNAYKKELKSYKLQSNATLASMGIVGITTIFFTYNVYNQSKINQDKAILMAEKSKALYESSTLTSDIETYKKAFNEQKEEYYKYNRRMYYSIPIGILGTYVTYKIYKYYKSQKKPQFVEIAGINCFIDTQNTTNVLLSFKFNKR
jgi:hypothetical protein